MRTIPDGFLWESKQATECWSTGVMEYWSIGVMEQRSNGVMRDDRAKSDSVRQLPMRVNIMARE